MERIDLDDILANDKIKYNSNNHWPNNIKPSNYDEIVSLSNTSYWIDKFKTYKKITINSKELSWMRECNKISEQTRKFSHQFDDELINLLHSHQEYDYLFDGTPYFVRCDNVSLKYGQHGVGPYYNLKQIIESSVSSLSGHSPIKGHDVLNFYLIPWVTINPDKEFRVFIYNGKLTCISQQNCYRRNSLDVMELEQLCKIIVSYWENTIKANITHINSYTIDIAILDDSTPYFIEINGFGKEYAAGSALFHWIIDETKLYGDGNAVHFRYI